MVTRVLLPAALLLLTACSADPAPTTVVEGRSTQVPGRACAPPSPLPSPPPQAVPLPPGAAVTAYASRDGQSVLTGRTADSVDEVLAHFRTTLEREGYVLSRDEDEGRAGELGFFGARADGTVTVARLTCPRGQTGFTLRLRGQ